MSNSVYFRKININGETKSVSIVVSSAPLTQTKQTTFGIEVGCRTQTTALFGVLSLTDPKTGKTINEKHPMAIALGKLNPGDEIPGYRFSTSPVMAKAINGEEPLATGLFWVESAE